MRAPTLAAGVAPHNHFERAHRALLDSGRGPEYFPLCRLHSLQRYGPVSSSSSAGKPCSRTRARTALACARSRVSTITSSPTRPSAVYGPGRGSRAPPARRGPRGDPLAARVGVALPAADDDADTLPQRLAALQDQRERGG